MTEKKKLAFILGIRPDVIRAALVINHLREYDDIDFVFIWSGQHYSDNLKSIFFRELGIEPAEIDLGCGGETDADVVAVAVDGRVRRDSGLRECSAVFGDRDLGGVPDARGGGRLGLAGFSSAPAANRPQGGNGRPADAATRGLGRNTRHGQPRRLSGRVNMA